MVIPRDQVSLHVGAAGIKVPRSRNHKHWFWVALTPRRPELYNACLAGRRAQVHRPYETEKGVIILPLHNPEGISQLEKFYLQEQLNMEKICMSKCDVYLNQVEDHELRGVIQSVRDVCKRHVDTLSNKLSSAGFMPKA